MESRSIDGRGVEVEGGIARHGRDPKCHGAADNDDWMSRG